MSGETSAPESASKIGRAFIACLLVARVERHDLETDDDAKGPERHVDLEGSRCFHRMLRDHQKIWMRARTRPRHVEGVISAKSVDLTRKLIDNIVVRIMHRML